MKKVIVPDKSNMLGIHNCFLVGKLIYRWLLLKIPIQHWISNMVIMAVEKGDCPRHVNLSNAEANFVQITRTPKY